MNEEVLIFFNKFGASYVYDPIVRHHEMGMGHCIIGKLKALIRLQLLVDFLEFRNLYRFRYVPRKVASYSEQLLSFGYRQVQVFLLFLINLSIQDLKNLMLTNASHDR